MKVDHLTAAIVLARASKCRVGIAEAATLLCVGRGSNSGQIAKALGVTPDIAKARLRVIRWKRLIEQNPMSDGSMFYTVSANGEKIVARILGTSKESNHEQA